MQTFKLFSPFFPIKPAKDVSTIIKNTKAAQKSS